MILLGIDEAQQAGATLQRACEETGLDVRTLQRWRALNGGEDQRRGPKTEPANKLTPKGRGFVVQPCACGTKTRFSTQRQATAVMLLAL